jgi:hypothetical protein
MRLPRRRTLWLTAALLSMVVGAWFLAPRSRITQANFDLVQTATSKEKVLEILGPPSNIFRPPMGTSGWSELYWWQSGPTHIELSFFDEKVQARRAHFATPSETLLWYAKKGAAKIGVKWD